MGQVLKGVVKWFNDAKGFGFIEHESGQDVFVHYSVIDQDGFKTLKDGEPVEYELREGDKGLNASRVGRINAKPAEENGAASKDAQVSATSNIEVDVEKTTSTSEEPVALSASESGDGPVSYTHLTLPTKA